LWKRTWLNAGNHTAADVAGEHVTVLAAATGVLLLIQDILKQVMVGICYFALLHSPLMNSCLIWCYGRDLLFFYLMVLSKV
jgi:hypothetical protein